MAKYPSVARTGHRMSPVVPRWSFTPTAKGSFLLLFKETTRWDGDTWESTAVSPGNSISVRKASLEGQVNSPERINTKSPRQNDAHNIV